MTVLVLSMAIEMGQLLALALGYLMVKPLVLSKEIGLHLSMAIEMGQLLALALGYLMESH